MYVGPSPHAHYPLEGWDKLIFLKNFVKAPNLFIGDYTYYDDRRHGPMNFEENNILYNYHVDRVKLVMGKFCAIAAETRFLMTGDHKLDGFSTYPFPIFGQGWEGAYDTHTLPIKGDIIVGNDVWFGYDSLIMSGAKIGHGAIIGARAVVKKEVPPYAVVAGNPARVVKMRFDPVTVERLLQLAWWEWDIEKITRNLQSICHANLDQLERAS